MSSRNDKFIEVDNKIWVGMQDTRFLEDLYAAIHVELNERDKNFKENMEVLEENFNEKNKIGGTK